MALDRQESDWLEHCLDNSDGLSAGDQDFVESLTVYNDLGKSLSEKQRDWLLDIYGRLDGP